MTELDDRLAGAVWGHLVGDAVGVPYEFKDAGEITTVTFHGYGTHNQQERVGQLVKFGSGRNVGHKGGRYLWQLADATNMLLAWQVHEQPAARESELLGAFVEAYGVLPFANLRW